MSKMQRFVRANSGAILSRKLKRNRKKKDVFGDAKLLMTLLGFGFLFCANMMLLLAVCYIFYSFY